MKLAKLMFSTRLFLVLAAAFSLSTAQAGVIAVGPGAFPGGSTLLNLAGLPDGLEVNGLTVGGVVFTYSLGNGNVVIDGGPGVTNHVNPPNIVSIGNPAGILTLTLPSLVDTFGYGYAILATTPVVGATTITLFNGVNNVGTLSYDGVVDPTFAGGFSGIQSTAQFNIVQLTFNSAAAPAFALDNVEFATANVPEPSTLLVVLSGAGFLLWKRRPK